MASDLRIEFINVRHVLETCTSNWNNRDSSRTRSGIGPERRSTMPRERKVHLSSNFRIDHQVRVPPAFLGRSRYLCGLLFRYDVSRRTAETDGRHDRETSSTDIDVGPAHSRPFIRDFRHPAVTGELARCGTSARCEKLSHRWLPIFSFSLKKTSCQVLAGCASVVSRRSRELHVPIYTQTQSMKASIFVIYENIKRGADREIVSSALASDLATLDTNDW